MANKVTQAGVDLIKSYEKLYLRPYDDFQPSKVLTATMPIKGTLTIGYGSTGKWIRWDTVISREKAEQLLAEDIANAEKIVNRLLKVALNDNQYSALVSFAFNTGGGYNDKNGKWHPYELWDYVNTGKDVSAKWLITAITSKGKQMKGLINRRTAEKDLFFS